MTKYLNSKEYDILCIIIHSEVPLNVSQIVKDHPVLRANIVQPVIRKLLKLNLIEVADIIVEGNIFSRRFRATASAPDTLRKMFIDDYLHFSKLVSSQILFNAMTQADKDPVRAQAEINEVKQLLQEYKEQNHVSKDK